MAYTLPKYLLIADRLMHDISTGKLPVGSMLPTESKLTQAYGVSRHTVRNAIQHLRARGQVSSRQGSGSVLVSREPKGGFVEIVQSIDELIAFGKETRREFVCKKLIEADEAVARMFRCEPGRSLAEATMPRITTGSESKPIAWVAIWLDALFEPAADDLEREHLSAAEIIASRFGQRTGSVVQTIQADMLDPKIGKALGADPGSAALVITKDYTTGPEDPPHLVSRSVYPAGWFKAVSRLVEAPVDIS